MAELQAIINQYTHTRPKLAHVGLSAMLYFILIRETNHQLLPQKIAELFNRLADITSRDPFQNQPQIHQGYRNNAEAFQRITRIVEVREDSGVVGMRYRFHAPNTVETRAGASAVNNAPR